MTSIIRSLYFIALIASTTVVAEQHVGKYKTKNIDRTKPITKIVSLAPHIVEMLYAIGAQERIVATTDYSDYPQAARKIPRIGGYHGVQIERIVELDPDLVIVWQSGNKGQDIETLEKLGLPLFYSKPKAVDDVPAEILALGELLELKAEANKIATDFRNRASALKQKYMKREQVSVFYQLWFDPMRTVGPGSWMQQIIEFCGANNVFDNAVSDYPVISLESVIEKKPEVFIIPTHHGRKAQTDSEKYWFQWPEIPAVKNKHMYHIDGDVLHRYSPRMLDGMQVMCEKIDLAR